MANAVATTPDFEFELISPEQHVMSQTVTMVTMPGVDGYVGVLAHHAPMIIDLGVGMVEIHADGQLKERVFINGGTADIARNRLTLLAEEVTPMGTMDVDQLRRSVEHLERVVASATVDTVRQTAEEKLSRSRTMLAAIEAAGGDGGNTTNH